jgi:hypothetical protein
MTELILKYLFVRDSPVDQRQLEFAELTLPNSRMWNQ